MISDDELETVTGLVRSSSGYLLSRWSEACREVGVDAEVRDVVAARLVAGDAFAPALAAAGVDAAAAARADAVVRGTRVRPAPTAPSALTDVVGAVALPAAVLGGLWAVLVAYSARPFVLGVLLAVAVAGFAAAGWVFSRRATAAVARRHQSVRILVALASMVDVDRLSPRGLDECGWSAAAAALATGAGPAEAMVAEGVPEEVVAALAASVDGHVLADVARVQAARSADADRAAHMSAVMMAASAGLAVVAAIIG